MNKQIICFICQRKMKRITNTHLWKSHRITMEEYIEKYPLAPIDAPGLAFERVSHLRGKTYEEVYGKEKASSLRKIRMNDTSEQMKDNKQIQVRQEKCGYTQTEEQRQEARERHTIHGGNTYRARALNQYGLECARCGFLSSNKSDFIVHHKNLVNIHSELGDHSLENLRVLCKKCHAILHNQISEVMGKFTGINNIEKGIHYIFKGLKDALGLDLTDPNFKDTPKRVARAYQEMLAGTKDTKAQIQQVLSTAFPSEGYSSLIFCTNITSYSLCPHHLLPVEYHSTVGYIPSKEGKVLGASKLPRVVDILSQRLVLQETLTEDIANALALVKPLGIAVVVSGAHYCMKMRGIRKEASFETSTMRGVFMRKPEARKEFFDLLLQARSGK